MATKKAATTTTTTTSGTAPAMPAGATQSASNGGGAHAFGVTASLPAERAPGTLPGYTSSDLHPEIVEALKAFDRVRDQYEHAIANINGQYLNSLVNTPAADQVEALRRLF